MNFIHRLNVQFSMKYIIHTHNMYRPLFIRRVFYCTYIMYLLCDLQILEIRCCLSNTMLSGDYIIVNIENMNNFRKLQTNIGNTVNLLELNRLLLLHLIAYLYLRKYTKSQKISWYVSCFLFHFFFVSLESM